MNFWKRVRRGEWEPETFAIFEAHIRPDTLYLDVGAWIGSTALFGAQLARKCIAFEPDPVAFAELSRNVAANAAADWAKDMLIEEAAVNADGQSFVLGARGAGSDSMSSALFPNRNLSWTVRARRLQDILSEHRAEGQPVFIKIDIEGGEYALLPTIRDLLADPLVTAYISFHPRLLKDALAARYADGGWQAAYLEQHLAVINSLPWNRRIASADRGPIRREALEKPLRKRLRFPAELLVCTG